MNPQSSDVVLLCFFAFLSVLSASVYPIDIYDSNLDDLDRRRDQFKASKEIEVHTSYFEKDKREAMIKRAENKGFRKNLLLDRPLTVIVGQKPVYLNGDMEVKEKPRRIKRPPSPKHKRGNSFLNFDAENSFPCCKLS